jgi:hypothetical protein
LVDELGAYVFDSRLNSNLMEFSENLPLKLPVPYVTFYWSNSTNKLRVDKPASTYDRFGCLVACACLYVGLIRSNPDVRTGDLSGTWGSRTDPVDSPSRVNKKIVCEWRSVLEISNHYQVLQSLTIRRRATHTDGSDVA